MKHKFLTITLSVILSLFFATPVLAQGPNGDQVIFGQNFTLQAEEKIRGDVVVFGGNVTIHKGGEIDGDLVVFGGNTEIDGTVTGDIGMIGGNIELGETAVVEGDIGLLGGEIERAEGAVVKGRVQDLSRWSFGDDEAFSIPPIVPSPSGEAEVEGESETGPVPPVPTVAPVEPVPPVPPIRPVRGDHDPFDWANRVFDFFGYVIGNVVFLVALAAVSWLVAAFMPEQMKVTGDTLAEAAPLSFGLGLLTAVLAAVIGPVLLITICLAFIPILGYILLGIAVLFGWIVIGQIIGERLLIATGQPYPNFVGSTVLGVMVLTLVANMPIIELVPCLGWILSALGALLGIVVSLAGLGAVILTRFGTRPYPSPSSTFPYGPSPAPVSTPDDDDPPSAALSPLERSEAELRAKIKATLAEADAAETGPQEETSVEEKPEESLAGATGAEEKSADETLEPSSPDAPKAKRRKAKPTNPEKPGDEPEQYPKDEG
jgi:cytoskeletal protein CcmA (bactofilin family)